MKNDNIYNNNDSQEENIERLKDLANGNNFAEKIAREYLLKELDEKNKRSIEKKFY